MKYKNYIKYALYIMSSILIFSIIITLLNYFDIINGILLKALKIVIPCLMVFIFSIILGKHSEKKGYLEGIKLGVFYILVSIIINLIFFRSFSLKTFLIYIAYILISVIGSILGINKKAK